MSIRSSHRSTTETPQQAQRASGERGLSFAIFAITLQRRASALDAWRLVFSIPSQPTNPTNPAPRSHRHYIVTGTGIEGRAAGRVWTVFFVDREHQHRPRDEATHTLLFFARRSIISVGRPAHRHSATDRPPIRAELHAATATAAAAAAASYRDGSTTGAGPQLRSRKGRNHSGTGAAP